MRNIQLTIASAQLHEQAQHQEHAEMQRAETHARTPGAATEATRPQTHVRNTPVPAGCAHYPGTIASSAAPTHQKAQTQHAHSHARLQPSTHGPAHIHAKTRVQLSKTKARLCV